MMETKAPIFVLVHGAFHPPQFYRGLIKALQARGHAVLAPHLPTTGLDDTVQGKTYLDDKERIYHDLLPRLDNGDEAVLVCHSLGGIGGSAVVENQTVDSRRARGRPGGVRAIVYIAAVVLAHRGSRLPTDLPIFYYPEVRHFPCPPTEQANRSLQGPLLKCDETASTLLYSSQLEPIRGELADQLAHQSLASISSRIHFVAGNIDIPKTYVVCASDRAIPPQCQRAWASEIGCRKIEELDSDHSPFLQTEKTEDLVKIILEAARTPA